MRKTTAFGVAGYAEKQGYRATVHHCCGDWLVSVEGGGGRRIAQGYDARAVRAAVRKAAQAEGGLL